MAQQGASHGAFDLMSRLQADQTAYGPCLACQMYPMSYKRLYVQAPLLFSGGK